MMICKIGARHRSTRIRVGMVGLASSDMFDISNAADTIASVWALDYRWNQRDNGM